MRLGWLGKDQNSPRDIANSSSIYIETVVVTNAYVLHKSFCAARQATAGIECLMTSYLSIYDQQTCGELEAKYTHKICGTI